MRERPQLVVLDEDEAMRKCIGSMLDAHQLCGRITPDLQQALRDLQDPAVYALLSDVPVCGLDSLDLLRLVRGRRPALPVILMAGFATREWGRAVRRAGAFGYLSKPFAVEDLVTVVRRAQTG